MAVIAVQKLSTTGLKVTYAAADVAGDSFANDERTALVVKNGGAGPITVTVSRRPCEYGTNHDLTVSIPAGEDRMVGPFDRAHYTDTVSVTYSAVTTVTQGRCEDVMI